MPPSPGPATPLRSAPTTSKFAVSAPGAATAGVSFQFTVTAEDKFGNQTPSYSGTVSFSSTDSAVGSFNGTLPAGTTLSSGLGTFSATLQTQGSQTLKASDSNLTSINWQQQRDHRFRRHGQSFGDQCPG